MTPYTTPAPRVGNNRYPQKCRGVMISPKDFQKCSTPKMFGPLLLISLRGKNLVRLSRHLVAKNCIEMAEFRQPFQMGSQS